MTYKLVANACRVRLFFPASKTTAGHQAAQSTSHCFQQFTRHTSCRWMHGLFALDDNVTILSQPWSAGKLVGCACMLLSEQFRSFFAESWPSSIAPAPFYT